MMTGKAAGAGSCQAESMLHFISVQAQEQAGFNCSPHSAPHADSELISGAVMAQDTVKPSRYFGSQSKCSKELFTCCLHILSSGQCNRDSGSRIVPGRLLTRGVHLISVANRAVCQSGVGD